MSTSDAQPAKKPIRVWVDGCFDMMHFGHANALRQAKALGDQLVVGVHSDASIAHHKGPPVMKEGERYAMVAACKWVDEVVEDAPWVTDVDWLERYNCDFVVHGDDIVTAADGEDCYGRVKAAGRFRTVPRTAGVSTTDLVGRMLLLTKSHFQTYDDDSSVALSEPLVKMAQPANRQSPYTKVTQFLPSSRRIVQFSEGLREPNPQDVIVYVDGAFDLFHLGHIKILEEAKKLGNYLIVGVLTDHVINSYKGTNYPIMNLHERVLGVLSCRYVDEVIIGAPRDVTAEMLDNMKVSLVVSGTVGDDDPDTCYVEPRARGIFRRIPSPSTLTTSDVIDRILKNYSVYEARNLKKNQRELSNIDTMATTASAQGATGTDADETPSDGTSRRAEAEQPTSLKKAKTAAE